MTVGSLWPVIVIVSQILSIFFPFTLRYINNKIGIKLPHLFRANLPTNERWLQKRKRANELIIISRITFETMKEFIRSRVRLVLMQIICYIPFGIYPWLLLPSQGCRRINFKKCSISTIYQPAEQKFLHVENIFKYTVDLRECPWKSFLHGLFGVQPNYITLKRCAIKKKKPRFSSQQFETDDALLLIRYRFWPLK